MKKTIVRPGTKKIYDTDTALFVGESLTGEGDSYELEVLYRKQRGTYFLYVEGGPDSKYSRKRKGIVHGISDIIPISYDEAKAWCKEHLDREDYEEEFGTPKESNVITTISVYVSDAELFKRYARENGMSIQDYFREVVKEIKTR